MNLRALRLTFSGPLLMLALCASGCATRPPDQQQPAIVGEDFHDPF